MADTVEYRLTNMSHYGLLAVASQETPSANLVTYMHARSAPQLRVTAQHPVITCLASHNTLNSLCNMVCKDYQTVALTSNSLIPRPFPASFQHRVSCLDCKYTSSHIEQPHSQAIPSLIPTQSFFAWTVNIQAANSRWQWSGVGLTCQGGIYCAGQHNKERTITANVSTKAQQAGQPWLVTA